MLWSDRVRRSPFRLTECPWHGKLASRVCGVLFLMTVAECQHVTLVYAPKDDQLEILVLRCREAKVGSGEVSAGRSGGHLCFSSPVSPAVIDYTVPV